MEKTAAFREFSGGIWRKKTWNIELQRETDNLGISSGTLAEKIAALGTDTHYFPSFDAIETFLLENCVNGDLLITMGAGDIVKVGEKLLGQ